MLAGPAGAECRLALALGMDVSRSVDARDYAIQHEGLIAALNAPEVRRAFLTPPDHVDFAVYEWSGDQDQRLVVPWTEVRGPGDLDAIIAQVAGHQRQEKRLATALGQALIFGRALLDQAPPCASLTLDMSGDGQNNQGISADGAYETADFAGVTVNGLAIGDHERSIVDYYQTEVIRGPGAFVISAPAQSDFPAAIRRKLARELSARLMGAADAPGAPG